MRSKRISSPFGRFLAARMVVGIAAGCILLLPAAWAPRRLAVGVLAWVLGSGTLVGSFVLRRSRRVERVLPYLLVLDLVAEILVVATTGATSSPFVLLFSLSIAGGGIAFGLVGGLLLAGAAAIGYWTTILLAHQALGLPSLFTGLFLLVLGILFGRLGRSVAAQSREVRRVQNELERVQLDAETIVASLSGPLLCLDRSCRVRRINPPAAELLRISGETHGRSLHELGPRERLDPLLRFVEEAFNGGRERIELDLPGVNGDMVTPVEVSVSCMRDRQGSVQGLVLLLGDLTLRKQQEAEQARQERLAVLGELSGHLAHEIRNSLKPVVGSIELLSREQSFQGATAELIQIILRESETLETFLSDFLFYARDKTLTVEDFDLDELVEELVASMQMHPARVERVQLGRLTAHPGGWIQADRKAVRDILRNLILNALEATSEGTVEVSCETTESDLSVLVEDSGIGLPKGDVEMLFEPFCTHKAGGTGLGLSIARRLARRMDGEVTLEPNAKQGTRARLILKSCRADQRAA